MPVKLDLSKNWPARLYVAILVLAGLGVWLLPTWWHNLDFLTVLQLAVLAAVASMLHVTIGRSRLSLEDVAIAAALVIGGPGTAVVLAPLGVALHVRGSGLIRSLLNLSNMVLSIAVAGWVYRLLDGPVGSLQGVHPLTVSAQLLLAIAASQVANAVLAAVGVRLLLRRPALEFLLKVVPTTFLQNLVMAIAGLPLAAIWLEGLGVLSSLLIVVPLVAARWALQQVGVEQAAQDATMRAFIDVVEAKDVYTRGHSERVRHGVVMVGSALKLSTDELTVLENAGLLHDCGKVGIPLSILRKPGRLTDEEMDVIRLHPARGVELMGNIPFLEESKLAVLHHHEKWDGTGYPSGLKGTEIPYFSRIIGIVDAFDCLTSTRSYRAAMSVDQALAILHKDKLSYFDPELVDVFTTQIHAQGWPFAEEAQPEPVSAEQTEPLLDHDDLGLSIPTPGQP